MKTNQPCAYFLPQVNTEHQQDVLERIELCGRVCYKSEEKITPGSADAFVQKLIRLGHESVLEHVDYIVHCSAYAYLEMTRAIQCLEEDGVPVLLRRTVDRAMDRCIISGNVRMWRDFMLGLAGRPFVIVPRVLQLFSGILFQDVQVTKGSSPQGCSLLQPWELLPGVETLTHATRTAYIVTDRGVSHELVRHRMASFSQESTRYCRYTDEMVFMEPPFWEKDSPEHGLWFLAAQSTESLYANLTETHKAKPQEARSVLNHSLRTSLYMTTNLRQWRHFFRLRCAPAAHPQMRQVALALREEAAIHHPGLFPAPQ